MMTAILVGAILAIVFVVGFFVGGTSMVALDRSQRADEATEKATRRDVR